LSARGAPGGIMGIEKNDDADVRVLDDEA